MYSINKRQIKTLKIRIGKQAVLQRDWSVVLKKFIWLANRDRKLWDFWGTSLKCWGTPWRSSSRRGNELINIFRNASIGTAVKRQSSANSPPMTLNPTCFLLRHVFESATFALKLKRVKRDATWRNYLMANRRNLRRKKLTDSNLDKGYSTNSAMNTLWQNTFTINKTCWQ